MALVPGVARPLDQGTVGFRDRGRETWDRDEQAPTPITFSSAPSPSPPTIWRSSTIWILKPAPSPASSHSASAEPTP